MKFEYFVIFILALIIGILVAKNLEKRNSNIIKLLFKRDLLPPAAKDTTWLQGSTCYMTDGSYGKVNGNYCEKIQVL